MVYEGGGGVEKIQKTVYVVYERPPMLILEFGKVIKNMAKNCKKYTKYQ